MNLKAMGKWAFLIGLVIAILAGFMTTWITYIPFALFALGLVVGFLNIADKDSTKFLVALIALMVLGVGGISALSIFGALVSGYLSAILGNFIAFVAAAGLVVSIKAVLEISRKR